MAGQPSKEYRVRIWVKLTDDLLPQPVLSKTEVEQHLEEALSIGDPDSPIVSVSVDDPVTKKPKGY
jgi:hypothetical protein